MAAELIPLPPDTQRPDMPSPDLTAAAPGR